MVQYSFSDRKCNLSWNTFLSLDINKDRLYRKDFKDFYALYEFIDLNKTKIKHLLCDGEEFFIRKGELHNLTGPAYIRIDEKGLFPGPCKWFYINGRMVCEMGGNACKKLDVFLKGEIFFYEEISGKQNGKDEITGKYYRRKEGIDYIRTPVNLRFLSRKEKLERLNDY